VNVRQQNRDYFPDILNIQRAVRFHLCHHPGHDSHTQFYRYVVHGTAILPGKIPTQDGIIRKHAVWPTISTKFLVVSKEE